MPKIICFKLNHEMVMSRHETICDNISQFRQTVDSPTAQEKGPVLTLKEDFAAIDASIVKMVVMTGSQFCFTHTVSAAEKPGFLQKTRFLLLAKRRLINFPSTFMFPLKSFARCAVWRFLVIVPQNVADDIGLSYGVLLLVKIDREL